MVLFLFGFKSKANHVPFVIWEIFEAGKSFTFLLQQHLTTLKSIQCQTWLCFPPTPHQLILLIRLTTASQTYLWWCSLMLLIQWLATTLVSVLSMTWYTQIYMHRPGLCPSKVGAGHQNNPFSWFCFYVILTVNNRPAGWHRSKA